MIETYERTAANVLLEATMESGIRVFLMAVVVAFSGAFTSAAEAAVTTFGTTSALPKSCSALFAAAKERDIQIQSAQLAGFENYLQKIIIEKASRGDRRMKIMVAGANASDLRQIAGVIAETLEAAAGSSTRTFEPWRIEIVVYRPDVNSLLEVSRDVRRALPGGQFIRYRFETADFEDARQVRRAEFEKPDVFLRIQ